MSIMTVVTELTPNSLMRKSKRELVDLVLMYADTSDPSDIHDVGNLIDKLEGEAELHRAAMRQIVFAVFGRDLAEDEHTDVDSICEWIRGLRAENQKILERAVQAEADARDFAELLEGGNWSDEFRARLSKYLDGAK